MLTEQDKAIGRTVMREVERAIGTRIVNANAAIKTLALKVSALEQELAKVKAHANQLEQAVLGLGNRR